MMADRNGIFAGDNPFELAQSWLDEAAPLEPSDPNAMALASVDADGMPNVRMVLLKTITADAFVFYTNFESKKGIEIDASGQVAFVLHWKSLRRQVRVRGVVSRVEGDVADTYYQSRALQSRIGAWASRQSQPLASRATLMAQVAKATAAHGANPERPPYWGGYKIAPLEVEFWADGSFRIHNRFRWTRKTIDEAWEICRISP